MKAASRYFLEMMKIKDFMKTIFQFNIFQFLSALGENITL